MATRLQKPGEVVIDGHNYTLGHWDVTKALETWAWLIESVGPGLKDIFERVQKHNKASKSSEAPPLDQVTVDTATGAVEDEDTIDRNIALGLDVFGLLIENLRKNIPPKEYADRMVSFMSDVLVDNRKVNPKVDFQGNLMHMHQLAGEVLKFQYKDFFDEALSIFNR